MKEVAYNLFLFIEGRTIREVGIVSHRLGGRDEVKLANLQSTARTDFAAAKRFPIAHEHLPTAAPTDPPGGYSYDEYMSMFWDRQPLHIFERALQGVSARPDPLFCITPVVDGVPRIEGVARM